jgi:hypothetical protein
LDVHLGGPLYAVLLTPSEEYHAISLTLNDVLREALNIDALELVFSDLKRIPCVGVLQEIVELLIIDLEEGAVGGDFETLGFDGYIELRDAPRNNALLLLKGLKWG